ncbi:hypothetical protein Syun_020506 [Stephania yunnanensis]|uniref:Uncharacterized protein n=1 Tax=Stephania yunnanensis TaxID=152371 RepID=A0AAP0NPQ5_9MAGN
MPDTLRHGRCWEGKPWKSGDRGEQCRSRKMVSGEGVRKGEREGGMTRPLGVVMVVGAAVGVAGGRCRKREVQVEREGVVEGEGVEGVVEVEEAVGAGGEVEHEDVVDAEEEVMEGGVAATRGSSEGVVDSEVAAERPAFRDRSL